MVPLIKYLSNILVLITFLSIPLLSGRFFIYEYAEHYIHTEYTPEEFRVRFLFKMLEF